MSVIPWHNFLDSKNLTAPINFPVTMELWGKLDSSHGHLLSLTSLWSHNASQSSVMSWTGISRLWSACGRQARWLWYHVWWESFAVWVCGNVCVWVDCTAGHSYLRVSMSICVCACEVLALTWQKGLGVVAKGLLIIMGGADCEGVRLWWTACEWEKLLSSLSDLRLLRGPIMFWFYSITKLNFTVLQLP